jgi:prepilin signal peptidase PulO-like enzyme (type II secretory pathway)
LEEEKSMSGRSFCPNCKHTLTWKDLIPLFSFWFLKGECRYCHKKISIQYPLVELIAGGLFLLIFILQPESFNLQTIDLINLVFLFYIASVLLVIFVYDFKHYLIPDKVLIPAIVITFIYRFLLNLTITPGSILNYILAVIIASGFFLAIFLLSSGRAMGFGDVKLAILMGLLLGFPNIVTALFLAFLFGAIIGLILMGLQKKKLKSEIPFGPFLITGTFIALLWGQIIMQWYLGRY